MKNEQINRLLQSAAQADEEQTERVWTDRD